MSQNNELNKIKLKIKALSNKTVSAGCSEHEAQVAMEMVGRLLSQYNLSMEEIDVRQQVCKTIHIKTKGSRRRPIDWTVVALANLVDAKVWFAQRYDYSNYSFFGQESDLELIQYLYAIIDSAIDTETETYKNSEHYKNARRKKSASVSFARGMASRISVRLNEMKRKNSEELVRKEQELYKATGNTELHGEAIKNNAMKGTALIVLKGQLIHDEFKKEGIKLRSAATSSGRITDEGAEWRGREAGNKINLSRPITNSNAIGGYIGS